MKKLFLYLFCFFCCNTLLAQDMLKDSATIRSISNEILMHATCYTNLKSLCKDIGCRLSGSPAAAKAVDWAQKAMVEAGADKVWVQPVNVPRWNRGKESLRIKHGTKGTYESFPMLSLGNSQGTKGEVLEAKVIMVASMDAFKALKDADIKGNIIFFNYRFRQDLVMTFEGYGDAGKYRWTAPNMASARKAAGVIIRSVSTGEDDYPHTGSMRYADTVDHIPAVAIGNLSADKLEAYCSKGNVYAAIKSECRMVDTVKSYNVIGEIKGSTYPDEIILVGGHLDSWDVGEGAQDDGAGCVQSIEVIRALKALHIRPKRTIRAVLFMNEENGLQGGIAYADSAKANHENHILAIETDAGGFSPRGFSMEMTEKKKQKIRVFAPLFLPYGVYDFSRTGGGADISLLGKQHVPMAELMPDPQRYFDLHHTPNDVFETVNHRELKLGSVALTGLIYLISEYGMN